MQTFTYQFFIIGGKAGVLKIHSRKETTARTLATLKVLKKAQGRGYLLCLTRGRV